MRVAGIINNSVVNGIGVRDVIFFQGCPHHCRGCHNPHTWGYDGGYTINIEDLCDKFKDSANEITLSGGEPILQYSELLVFMKYVNREQHKRFWIYTGFRYEEIPPNMLAELSEYVDVLVDGKFEEDKKDLKLQFRGSSNQRLINLPESVKKNKIVIWEECE